MRSVKRAGHSSFIVILLTTLLLLTSSGRDRANATSAVFGGGPFYSGGTSVMNDLRGSGFTTVMLWSIHVNSSSGDLVLNDQRIISGGAYVGNAAWPGQLLTLKQAPTSVRRIEVSVGSAGVSDFQSIQTLIAAQGTNTTSILYRNFQALKTATGADAVDLDDESLYDVTTTVKFCLMCASLGYKVSLCPYTAGSFWSSCMTQINAQSPGTVDAVYLQCYAGGAGNNPASWNTTFGGFKVYPGLWCLHGSGCSSGDNPASVAAKMANWKNAAGINGGFMWLYDDMQACVSQATSSNYASAINGTFKSAAPTNLVATPGGGAVLLSWNGVLGADSYNLKRSSASGGPYVALATNLTNLFYWDQGLAAGVPWFYEVSAVSSAGEGANSSPSTATPCKGNLPAGWTDQDIGSVGLAGGASACGTTYIVQGSGSDIWGMADSFNFASASTAANSAIVARVASLQGPDPWTKGGVIFRNDSGNGSMFVDLVVTPGNGISLQWRSLTDGQCSSVQVTNIVAPVWLQLVRFGTNFAGYFALDGINWTQVGNVNVAMTDNALSGLAVTAHNNSAIAVAIIDNVSGGAPAIVQQPTPSTLTRLAGAGYTLRVGASAALPVSYFWQQNGALIAGATNASFALTSLAVSDAGNYSVVVSNAFGSVTSSAVALSVLSTSNSPYAQTILADHPIAYWRLDETNGTVASDYVGGNNGVYSNVLTAQIGYNLLDTPQSARFGSVSASNSLVKGLPIDFATSGNAAFSVEAWVNGGAQTSDSGIITKGTGSGGEQFNLDCGGGSHAFRFFVRDSGGGAHLATSTVVPNNKWRHLIGVCDQARSNVLLYVDGTNVAQGTITPGSGLLATATPMTLGSRQSGAATAFDFQFVGNIEDAAVYNYALSAAQAKAHFSVVTNRAPAFLLNPFTIPGANAGQIYSSSIAGSAADPNGDALTFSKISGPDWLSIAGNGGLSGISYSSNVGLNSFQVRVTDSGSLATSATMSLTVTAAPPINVSAFLQETNLILNWTGGIAPYQVQTKSNLVNPTWDDLGSLISTHGLSLSPSNPATYFRIRGQ